MGILCARVCQYVNPHLGLRAFLIRTLDEEPALSTTLFGIMILSRGIGNVLSTPIATALTGAHALSTSLASGYAVAGGKYGGMIIYSGSCFAGAAGLALFGWKTDSWALRRVRLNTNDA